ncbi:MAG TPA: adenylate/guanylate cyclase domain-containing protein [Casimicrobiaceae bacterium]
MAAIVCADVAGYSRLMGSDESGTLAALKAHRRNLIDPTIAEYGGRIVNTAGDGLLLEFASVVDAVRCAVAVQRGMAERNGEVAADRRIEFRIGINVGDIILDEDDIFGDGVNVAARLQALADPGGICVSRVVRDHVRDKLGFVFEDLGSQQVKNIARPVEAYRVDWSTDGAQRVPAATAPRSRITRRAASGLGIAAVALALGGVALWSADFRRSPAAGAAPPLSVAVLPFTTSAGGSADAQFAEQFADQFTRDLVSMLRHRSHGALVAPQAAAVARDGTAADARALGRNLNVRYLVDGAVQRDSEHVFVDLHLIDAANAGQVWGQRLALDASRLSPDQARFAARAAEAIYEAVHREEARRAPAQPASNASAVELWLHAWRVWARDDNSLSGALAAREWFDRALQRDPDFVPALLGRLRTLHYEFDLAPGPDRDRLLHEMEALSFRAISIDPEDTYAWLWRDTVLELQWRWDAAIEANAKAERLMPYNEWAINQKAGIMIYTGRPEEALALVDRQLAFDPATKESLGWAMLQRCRAYMAVGRYDEAIDACQRDVALDNWWLPHAYLIAGYAQSGQAAKAGAEKAALLALRPQFSIADFKAQRFSDNAEFWRQTEAHLFAGLRKAGIREQ